MGPRATPRSIAVVGAGYVGLVSAVGFAGMGHAVELVETDPVRLAALRRGEVPFTEAGVQEALTAALASSTLIVLERAADTTSDIVLVCVGTPIDDHGKADTDAVELVVGELARRERAPVIVVRSTLPVGTSKRLLREAAIPDTSRFFLIPEFLRQGAALEDFRRPTRLVIGCPPDADPAAREALVDLFGAFAAPLLTVTLEESELIKNGANAFLALKISFANEIASLAERAGADAGPVLKGIGLDPRIGASMLNPSFGFGGSCLPKELATIAISGRERGLEMHVTSAAAEANQAHQKQFAERIAAVLDGVAGRRIALLGLAFKAGTDDIRSSPAVALARWLMEHDAILKAHDPAAGPRATRAVPGLIVTHTALEALDGAEAAVVATEWPAYRELDWATARDVMSTPLVIDGRRLLDADLMVQLGFVYQRVGTPGEVATSAR
jgi:UDPglucose 6-dehydrogenase